MRSLLLFLTLFTLRLHAQLDIALSLERENLAEGEPIRATVTVTNTTGRDIVLNGPTAGSWLNFLIRDGRGQPSTATEPLPVRAMVARAGQATQRTFSLGQHYFVNDPGSYIARAAVYVPDLQRWVSSRPAGFNIRPMTKPKWTRTISMPKGHPQAGQFRRYEVHTFLDQDKSYLMVRIVDEGTRHPIYIVRLSSLITREDIQPAVDEQTRLHLFYLGSPTVWVYQIVDADGRIQSQQYFTNGKGRPQLVTNSDGSVYVGGGTLYDPTEKPATEPFRRLSERPAGVLLPP